MAIIAEHRKHMRHDFTRALAGTCLKVSMETHLQMLRSDWPSLTEAGAVHHSWSTSCRCSWSCGRWVWNFSHVSVYVWGPILFDLCIVSIHAHITWRGSGYVNKFPDFLRLSWERCLKIASTDSPGDRFVVTESFLNLMRLCIFYRIRQWQLSALRQMGGTLPVLDLALGDKAFLL